MRGEMITWDCLKCGKTTSDYKSQKKHAGAGRFCSVPCARSHYLTGKKIGLGKGHSIEWRLLMSEKLSGDKCHLWKGGVTAENERIRKSARYKIWRESVYKRDDYTCQICSRRGGITLNSDHIKPFAFFPELRFELDNGRTLCVDCHRKTDTFGTGASKLYSSNLVVI